MSAAVRVRRGFNRLAFVVALGFILCALLAAFSEVRSPSGSIFADPQALNAIPGASYSVHVVEISDVNAVNSLLSSNAAILFAFRDGRAFRAVSLVGAKLGNSDIEDINKSVAAYESLNLSDSSSSGLFVMHAIAFRCETNCYWFNYSNAQSHLKRHFDFGFPAAIAIVGLILSAAILVLSYVIRGFLL